MNTTVVQARGRPPERSSGFVAIVGRPNVGKSTLFNRLTGGKTAIVDNFPGVTRDRNYGEAKWLGRTFSLIDTGGFEPDPTAGLKKQIQEQSRLAIEEADIIVFLFDGKMGLNPLDREAAGLLRRVKKPVLFAVNKIDTKSKENLLYEFYALGLSEIFPLSAEHGIGVSELMDRIMSTLSKPDEESVKEETPGPRLAIVGRPNVGKSTLVNRLLGYERSVVDAHPGTTRDALECSLTWMKEQYTLVDTAGIRRRARIVDRVERYSVVRSLRSVDRGDVIIHLLDGPEGITSQDAQIMAYTLQRGKGSVLAVNKWDLIPKNPPNKRDLTNRDNWKPDFLNFAPVVFISALTGYGLSELMERVHQVSLEQQQWFRTSTLNQTLRETVGRHTPPQYRGREVKFYYGTQTDICPPTFTLFVNYVKGVPTSYERYLIHRLRSNLKLANSPIRLLLRARRERRDP